MANLLSEEEELRRFNAAQSDQPWYARALPMEGRATILPFRDTMPGSVFNKREFALPGLLAEAVNAFTSPARSLLGTDPEFNPQKEASNMALNMFGGGIATGKALRNPTGVGGTDLALNVWHGTPHKIKGGFDISKVGTGEGAQAYGHGIYFAENPNVAKEYQKRLASDRGFSFDGKSGLTRKEVQDLVNAKYGSGYLDGVIRPSGVADSFIDDMVTGVTRPEGSYPRQYKTGSERAKIYDELRGKIIHANPGNLYKADIPDEMIPKMINWDKPFNEQPVNIQEAFKKFDSIAAKDKDRNTIYMQRWFRSPSTAKELQELGYTGFQYLDEGSRAAGKGTSNYVVFDPSTVKILEKNGIKVEDLIEKGLLGE